MSGHDSAVRWLDLPQGFEVGVCERPPRKCYTAQKSVNAGNVMLTNGARMVPTERAGIAVKTRPLAAGRKTNVALCATSRIASPAATGWRTTDWCVRSFHGSEDTNIRSYQSQMIDRALSAAGVASEPVASTG